MLTRSLHQIEALVKAGVKDIVLAVNYRPEVMVSVLKKTEEEFGINITFSVETEPLGTGASLLLDASCAGAVWVGRYRSVEEQGNSLACRQFKLERVFALVRHVIASACACTMPESLPHSHLAQGTWS